MTHGSTAEDPLWPRASGWLRSGGSAHGPRLGILGVPLSQASLSPSAAHTTPAAVRSALRRFSTFHAGLDVDLETVAVTDHGDVAVAELGNEAAQQAVEVAVRSLPPAELLVLIGGDNALTRPALRGLAPDLTRAALLTLDAHHDVRAFHAGPTNGTPVRGLIEDGLPGDCVVQIGIAPLSNSRVYRQWCDDHGITVVDVEAARREGVGRCVRRHLDRLAAAAELVYVDLDLDVLDSAFAPGCPGARPGGLLPGEVHDAAVEAGRHPAVVAVDLVEVDAEADVGGVTVDNQAMSLLCVAAGLALRHGSPTGAEISG